MNQKLEGYITTLEKLLETATNEDQAALAYAIQKLEEEKKLNELEMFTV